MTALVIVLAAPCTVTSSVRDVLRDWVALGLVQPFVWVDAADVPHGGALSDVVATHVQATGAPRVLLQSHLADQRNLELVRLVSLGAIGEPTAIVHADAARALEAPLKALLPGRVVTLQCLLPEQGAGGWRDDVEIPGWQTIVLAPEDCWSPSPQQPSTEFSVGGDRTQFISHAAAGLAAVAAIWTGLADGPFDTDRANAEKVVGARAFLRRLDSSQVTARLRSELMDVTRGLPRPQSRDGRCEHLQEPAAAVGQIVGAIRERHAPLFALSLEEPAGSRKEKISAWQAVKEFCAFVGGVLSRAPGALVQRAVHGGATGVARRVQNALYGGMDSQYEVVTRGVNAKGLPAGVSDVATVATAVQSRIATVIPGEQTTPDLSDLWVSVVYGGLTLADGGERIPGIGPILIGGKPGVVRDTDLIAPAPDDKFVLGSVVSPHVGMTSVSPYDIRQHQQVAQTLAGAPPNDHEAQSVKERFDAWRTRMASSYTGELGRQLGDVVQARTTVLARLLEQLRADQGDQLDRSKVEEESRSARRVVMRFLFGVLTLVAVVVIVAVLHVIGILLLALLALAALIGWLAAHVMALLRHQQRIFALINAQLQAEEALAVAARNLPRVANALFVATTMYEQYLQWAPVLGRFLHQPFGPLREVEPPAGLHGLLPRAVGFGIVEPDPDKIAAVAYEIGSTIYDRGWLSPLWQALFDDAGHRLGPVGLPLRKEPGLLWGDNARGPDSLLRQWSTLVAEEGVKEGAGDALWAKARSAVMSRGAFNLTSQLLTTVDVQAQSLHEANGRLSGTEFFTVLTDALGDVFHHYLQPSLFTPQALANELHRVVRTVALGRQEVARMGSVPSAPDITWIAPAESDAATLDQFLVVVQMTTPARADAFTLRGPAGRMPPPPPPSSGAELPDLGG
jgi:hypothetical protein